MILMTFCFQDSSSSHDLNTLVPGQSQGTISVSDNVGGHKNKESSNDGEPTAAEKYSTETTEKYLAATGPGVSVAPGVKHHSGNNQPEDTNSSLEVRKYCQLMNYFEQFYVSLLG